MLNLPAPPETLVTRSLRCVSCREQFTVSEGNTQGISTPTPDHYPDIGLRYQPDLTRRPIVPESRAAPEETVEPYDGPGPIHVVCPRCGADNRNWLRITTDSTPWYRRFPIAAVAVPAATGFTLIIGILFFIDPLIRENVAWPLRVVLLLFMLGTGIVTSWITTPEWSKIRDQLNRRRYLSQKQRPFLPVRVISIAVIMVGLVPVLFFVLFPTLVEAAPNLINPPAAQTTVSRIDNLLAQITPEQVDQATPGQRTNLLVAAYGLQTAVNAKQTACNTLPVQDAITTLVNLQNNTLQERQQLIPQIINRLTDYQISDTTTYCRTELLQSAITQLNVLAEIESSGGDVTSCAQDGSDPACYARIIQTLVLQLEQMLPNDTFPANYSLHEQLILALQNARTFQLNTPDSTIEVAIINHLQLLETFVKRETDVITISQVFFINWFIFVGIAAVGGTILGYIGTDAYAQRVNRQLPPPVYATVANMTRVVIWEARRALEIQRHLEQIQWLRATRNADGGITLIGLERDMPDFDNQTNNLSDRIRAQKYHIISDQLGHITSATVSDVMVRRSLAGPGYAFPGWEQALPAVPRPGNITIIPD